jgi:ferritin-like protein
MSTVGSSPEGNWRRLGILGFAKMKGTRRAFVNRLLAAGGSALVSVSAGAALMQFRAGSARAALSTDNNVVNFGNAAVGAERIGIAFYGNALGTGSRFSLSSDLAKGTLLNSAHRVYFQAAFNQETQHLQTLQSLGLSFPFTKFGFPAETFDSAKKMLAFGEALESIFIGAYLGAILASATAANKIGDDLGVAVAELAAQICGIECEHRVLIRDIAGLNPPNDRFFEGTQPPGQTSQLGNTGIRSTVFATGDAAVAALVALGIKPT